MKEVLIKNFHWFIIVYAGVGLFTVYEEKMEEIEGAKSAVPPMEARIIKSKRKISEIKKFKKNLEKSKERVKEVVKQIEKVQKQLPSDVNDTEVQALIANIAKELRVKNPRANPEKERMQGFYYEKDYKFEGVGTFLQFLIFFENLEKAERILNVKNLKMILDPKSKASRFPIVNLETTVESFRYNTSYKEKSLVNEIEKKFSVD